MIEKKNRGIMVNEKVRLKDWKTFHIKGSID
jgi:hypothetical protein